MFMLTNNLFRALRPLRGHDAESGFDGGMDEEEPALEPAWPHLQVRMCVRVGRTVGCWAGALVCGGAAAKAGTSTAHDPQQSHLCPPKGVPLPLRGLTWWQSLAVRPPSPSAPAPAPAPLPPDWHTHRLCTSSCCATSSPQTPTPSWPSATSTKTLWCTCWTCSTRVRWGCGGGAVCAVGEEYGMVC